MLYARGRWVGGWVGELVCSFQSIVCVYYCLEYGRDVLAALLMGKVGGWVGGWVGERIYGGGRLCECKWMR